MGYYIEMDIDVTIEKENVADCLKVINAMHTPEFLLKHAKRGSFPRPENPTDDQIRDKWCYSWVRNPDENGFPNLIAALDEWGYGDNFVLDEESGDIVIDSNYRETKIGNDELFWGIIAPFVKADSSIEIQGECGAQWKWNFDGKSMIELNGEVVYR